MIFNYDIPDNIEDKHYLKDNDDDNDDNYYNCNNDNCNDYSVSDR